VPNEFADDYVEAKVILADSPRMSAVLSRRILADLLKKYAGLTNFKLSDRINAFINNPAHPSRIKQNLHYLREIADFGAHTMTDSEDRVINATADEAEWTLKVVDDLFDYSSLALKRMRICERSSVRN
jgi:hypothetical protein